MEAGKLWKSTVELPMTAVDVASNVLSGVVSAPAVVANTGIGLAANSITWTANQTARLATGLINFPTNIIRGIVGAPAHLAKSLYYPFAGGLTQLPETLKHPFTKVSWANLGTTLWSRALETVVSVPSQFAGLAKNFIPFRQRIASASGRIAGLGRGLLKTGEFKPGQVANYAYGGA